MSVTLQLELLLGSVCLLAVIFYMLKKNLLSVKYSLLWLFFAAALILFAAVPYVVYVLRDILNIEIPVNLVFVLLFCFVLLVLLSVSVAISQLAEKAKRLAQSNALLEKRVRELENKLDQHRSPPFRQSAKSGPNDGLVRQYLIILSADTASEVRQLLSQKHR